MNLYSFIYIYIDIYNEYVYNEKKTANLLYSNPNRHFIWLLDAVPSFLHTSSMLPSM